MREKILKIASGHIPARILMVANRLGLFRLFGSQSGSVTSREAARRLRTHPDPTERLLNALVVLGLLLKRNGRYRLAAGGRAHLTSIGTDSVAASIALSDRLWPLWGDLDRMLRSGRPPIRLMERVRRDKRMLRSFIHAMTSRSVLAARMIRKHLDLKPVQSLLDVGAGPGTYSLEWLKSNPRLSATLFDTSDVVPITREYVRSYGLEKRVKVMAGDFNRDPFGKGYDLVLLANVLQMYGAPECLRLIKKTYSALKTGGRVIIHGFMTDATGTRPVESALFALSIALVTPSGNAHPVPRVCRWLKAAGFRDLRMFTIDLVPPTVIVARK